MELVTQSEAIVITETILETFRPGRWAKFESSGYFTDDGFAIFTYEDFRFIAGFGILSGLNCSTGLLRAIDVHNKRANMGHVWLAEGSDGTWSLVWSEKLILDFLDRDSYGRNLANPLLMYEGLLDSTQGSFREFGGRSYWPDRTLDTSRGLFLLTHIR